MIEKPTKIYENVGSNFGRRSPTGDQLYYLQAGAFAYPQLYEPFVKSHDQIQIYTTQIHWQIEFSQQNSSKFSFKNPTFPKIKAFARP